MKTLSTSRLRLAVAAMAFGAILGTAGCTGHRYDMANHSADQAFYTANPKCADGFHPCQSP